MALERMTEEDFLFGKPLPPAYRLGDLVLVYGKKDLLSRLIRWGTRSKGEKRTKITHVAVITEVPPGAAARDVRAVGAEWRVRQRKVSEWNDRMVVSATFLDPEQREAIARRMIHSMGRKYGWCSYITFALDEKLLGGENIFRRLTRSVKRPVCSTLAAWAYLRDAEYIFEVPRHGGAAIESVPWYALTPDDMADAIERSLGEKGDTSGEWTVVEDTR